jgi:hypothetical protein
MFINPQAQKFRQQYLDVLAAFQAAFPGVQPPESHWFQLWMTKYGAAAIEDAIQTLSEHPLKSKFTQESTGRALSALLREATLKRAFAMPVTAVRK